MYKKIAVDCDEVLAETVVCALEYHQHQFNGKPLFKEQVTNFFWKELEGYDASATYTANYREEFFQHAGYQITPVQGAYEVLQNLQIAGYDLVVVTSRWDTIQEMTRERIANYFPGIFSSIIFPETTVESHYMVNKSDLMRQIGADILIDDALHNVLDLQKSAYPSLLLDKPRNQQEKLGTHIRRVKNRQEIAEVLLG